MADDVNPLAGALIENETEVPTEDVLRAIGSDNNLIAQLSGWVSDMQGIGGSGAGYGGDNGEGGWGQYGGWRSSGRPRVGGLFERDRYVTPHSLYEQMRMAYDAVESDDVVGGIADTTEALAFTQISMYAEDGDEEDIYNQIMADIDLDARLREMWREDFTCSQFYCAVWWGDKHYKVRGTTDRGNTRRKEFSIRCPTAITMIDPLRVVPVGNTMFNRESLAYIADEDEAIGFDGSLQSMDDPIVSRLLLGRYTPTLEEQRWMSFQNIPINNLFLLNPATVFRHTDTRSQFRRLAPLRMKSVFELLDLKHQVRSMDRAHLIGGTNFIVLIKKGTDKMPAKNPEIKNLQEQVRTVAKLPVLVGDHRLSVEIITPKMDQTLDKDRYGVLDSRITARLYGMFVTGGSRASVGTTTDDSSGLVKVVARGIEARRRMIQRTLERNVLGPLFQLNDALTTAPKLRFHPRHVDLAFDAGFANLLLELRQSNEISRDTLLSQFDLDEDDEARMLEREAETYDKIFQTQVPFSTPNPRGGDPAPATTPAQKRQAGRQGGGLRNGGGAAPGTGQGKKPVDPNRTSD